MSGSVLSTLHASSPCTVTGTPLRGGTVTVSALPTGRPPHSQEASAQNSFPFFHVVFGFLSPLCLNHVDRGRILRLSEWVILEGVIRLGCASCPVGLRIALTEKDSLFSLFPVSRRAGHLWPWLSLTLALVITNSHGPALQANICRPLSVPGGWEQPLK